MLRGDRMEQQIDRLELRTERLQQQIDREQQERLRKAPSPRLAARLFELSHAQLLEIAVAGCKASLKVTNHTEAILAANNPLAQRLVEGVLLSSDLAPLLLAPLPLEDGAAAAVCSLWAKGWKATSEGRRRLTRVAFDLPADVLEDCHGMAAIPGDHEKLAVCSSRNTVTILDRSMRTVSSFTDDMTNVGVSGCITADEQSVYISEDYHGHHLRLSYDGTELARYEVPDGGLDHGVLVHYPVLAPGGLLFCIHHAHVEAEDDDQHRPASPCEIIALDAHSMQLRYRFGKSLLDGACGLAVVGEELFVCDMLNDRLQVFSFAGEHHRSITGEWKRPEGLCVMKDRLYLVERMGMEEPATAMFRKGRTYEDIQTCGRRIFLLSMQGDTLQVYPIPARKRNSFSSGDLCCFDGKLLVPMQNSDDPLDIVALARMPLPPARWPRST